MFHVRGRWRRLKPQAEDAPETHSPAPRAAEFFAGIGLVRLGLEQAGFRVVWANDIETSKQALYHANFGSEDFVLADIRSISGRSLPDVDLATASFPCTDLSLAGNRAGLAGKNSGMFWEFARVIEEMGPRKPRAVMIENVPSFATSHGGNDLARAVGKLNELGYYCDLFAADAKWFVPQSRLRLFIVGSVIPLSTCCDLAPNDLRPSWISSLIQRYPGLVTQAPSLTRPQADGGSLEDVIDRFPSDDSRWWNHVRLDRFHSSLSVIQRERLADMRQAASLSWAAAFRRTRQGRAVWEIRADRISGCLRTARGGSSKQAIVEAGFGEVRIRWMTSAEYSRLQGAPAYRFEGFKENQVLSGFGDAVCVPVISWIARAYLGPLLNGQLSDQTAGPARRLVETMRPEPTTSGARFRAP